jgi:hypothetical protein
VTLEIQITQTILGIEMIHKDIGTHNLDILFLGMTLKDMDQRNLDCCVKKGLGT